MISIVTTNLVDELINKSNWLDKDSKFKPWAKFVTFIDHSKSNGYAFSGDLIKDGTIEIEFPENKPKIIMACARYGSRRGAKNYYQFFVLQPNGQIEVTDIKDDDGVNGWAIRVKPLAQKLIDKINNQSSLDYSVITNNLVKVDLPISEQMQKELNLFIQKNNLSLEDMLYSALTLLIVNDS